MLVVGEPQVYKQTKNEEHREPGATTALYTACTSFKTF